MVYHVVVGRRGELIRVEVLDHASLPSGTNTLLASLSPGVNLNMHHIVLLLPHLWVVVAAADEDKVSWLHLLLCQSDGQTIKLIRLIPSVKLEAKFFSQIINDLPN